MKLTKAILERGIIIRPDGSKRKYYGRAVIKARVKEGEVLDIFSEEGVKSIFRNDGIKNSTCKKKKIITKKTVEQATAESLLTLFYFSCTKKQPMVM